MKFKQGLKARGYPENIMEWSLSGVSFASRQSFLAHTQKLKGHQRLLWRGTGGGRGQEAGEQGARSRIYMRAGSGSRNREGGSLLFIIGYYLVKNTHLLNFHLISTKGQKMNKNVMFWHSLKIKPGFLILLINLKTGATQ